MNEELKEKFSTIMYFLTKEAARYSFEEFLEDLGIEEKDWYEIKKHLEEKYNVKTYV